MYAAAGLHMTFLPSLRFLAAIRATRPPRSGPVYNGGGMTASRARRVRGIAPPAPVARRPAGQMIGFLALWAAGTEPGSLDPYDVGRVANAEGGPPFVRDQRLRRLRM
jgi:hypothetical protein